MAGWMKVPDHNNKVVGRIRRLSEPFALEEWEVKGLPGVVFEDSLDAMKYLLEERGMTYQVKTELSHRYWDGHRMREPMDHEAGRRYRREFDAQRVADRFETGASWDRVCVVEHVDDNWGRPR